MSVASARIVHRRAVGMPNGPSGASATTAAEGTRASWSPRPPTRR
jgi:hypothetical protein